jgi:hypothetical protein
MLRQGPSAAVHFDDVNTRRSEGPFALVMIG